MEEIRGYIHSIETFGALDGPGIRYVVFLQGCLLRCRYCHNPDTWRLRSPAARVMTPGELYADIEQYRSFIAKGGVTFSGGEPLLQPRFARRMIGLCGEGRLHTAVDTSGAVPLGDEGDAVRSAAAAADLLLLDIKALDPDDCVALTGRGNADTLRMLDFRESLGKDVWIRHVLVPGITLDEEKLEKLADFLTRYTCVRKVELLPFHKMGEYKWRELRYDYTLWDVPAPAEADLARARAIFARRRLL